MSSAASVFAIFLALFLVSWLNVWVVKMEKKVLVSVGENKLAVSYVIPAASADADTI